MKKSLYLLLLAVTAMALSSCDLDDDTNFYYVSLPVTSVELPEAFELNETYEIKVKYIRPDNCTYFEGFDVSKTDTTTRNVVVVGTTLDDVDCMETEQEVENTFNFVVLYTDTYLFRFWTGENEDGEQEYLELEVPVLPASEE
ncbi:MAG: hypothetical protein V7724_03770 [Sediminicola sp.]|tara:strand:+ start:250 stop:678 length:429 start_codon:yes stop_codon:yes gene_type:complete